MRTGPGPSHENTPQSVLDAPVRTVTPACPARKCKKTEGHDDGVHGLQRRRGTAPRRYPVSRYRPVRGIKRAPYDPVTPRRSRLLREIEREMRRRSSGA